MLFVYDTFYNVSIKVFFFPSIRVGRARNSEFKALILVLRHLLLFFYEFFLKSVRKYGGSSTEQKTFLDSHPYLETCYQVTFSVRGMGFRDVINVILRKQIGISWSSSLIHIAPPPTQQLELIWSCPRAIRFFFNFLLFVCHYIDK